MILNRRFNIRVKRPCVSATNRTTISIHEETKCFQLFSSWTRRKYSVTTVEPGVKLVLTKSGTFMPSSTARFATSPAATMTDGFDVFVQLVICGEYQRSCLQLSIFPSATTVFRSSCSGSPYPYCSMGRLTASSKLFFKFPNSTRSCGLFGPAILGLIDDRSAI